MEDKRLSLRCLTLCAIFLVLPRLSAASSIQNDSIINGIWTVEYLVLDPQEAVVPVSAKTAAYTQIVRHIHRGYIITVISNIEPVAVKSGFKFDPGILHPELRDPILEKNLAVAKTAPEAVRTALEWVERNVKYSDNPGDSQDFTATIKRASGNCVGRAEVLLKLLNSLGISARAVGGCLYQNGDAQFHKWVEIDYTGLGTLPSEPGSSQDFVTPYHILLLPSETVSPSVNRLSELGIQISITREEQSFWTIDRWPPPEGCTVPISRRQTAFHRFETVIAGRVRTGAGLQCIAELTTGTGVCVIPLNPQGFFSFIPVTPGPFHLAIRQERKIVCVKEGHVMPGELIQLFCDGSNDHVMKER